MILIVITLFQIQCHNVGVCHCGEWWNGERRQGGVLLLDVQEAGQWEVRGGADVGGTEYKSRKGVCRVLKEEWVEEVDRVEWGLCICIG